MICLGFLLIRWNFSRFHERRSGSPPGTLKQRRIAIPLRYACLAFLWNKTGTIQPEALYGG
jgi:hypothetical protein